MNRRRYLAALATAGVGSVAGCGGLVQRQSTRAPPLVENRPDAVYYPTHVEGMTMVGMATAGRLRLALSYSFPHRFWLVDGDRTNQVEVTDADSVHLMLNAWDGETGTSIPTANPSITVTKGGETVARKSLWRMLSQNMGFHFGDNVALDGDGTYDVSVAFGPVGTRRTGGFRDAFGERVTASFSLEFSRSSLEAVSYRELGRAGTEGAVEPMAMEMMPVPQLPSADELPGTALGTAASGDATFLVGALDEPPAGVDGSGPYLVVSPRTPYNRYPLPFMSLSATLASGGETVHDGALTPTLDPDLAYHYGAAVEAVDPGAELTLTPQTPPQISRHEGYETAFLDVPAMDLTVA